MLISPREASESRLASARDEDLQETIAKGFVLFHPESNPRKPTGLHIRPTEYESIWAPKTHSSVAGNPTLTLCSD